jgi:hypothetical protein
MKGRKGNAVEFELEAKEPVRDFEMCTKMEPFCSGTSALVRRCTCRNPGVNQYSNHGVEEKGEGERMGGGVRRGNASKRTHPPEENEREWRSAR